MKSLFLLLSLTSALLAQPSEADFFIPQSISDFQVFDRYQQKIDNEQLGNFVPFTPFEITERNGFLSDGFTPVMATRLNSRSFYILLDDISYPITKVNNSVYDIIEKCTVFEEKIRLEIVVSKGALSKQVPFSKRRDGYTQNHLTKGTQITKLFQKGRSVYSEFEDGSFGWVRFSSADVYRPVIRETISAQNIMGDDGFKEAEFLVGQVNDIFKKLFSDLSNMQNKPFQAPVWKAEKSEQQLAITLENASPDHFAKTSQYLVNEIETLLSGEPYRVVILQDSIIVTAKVANE